ncbi:FecCD family ABC transporter permease [Gordonia sp. (in: high G+C Gram-positive bacteria)]|uniref:FecCD family ABC transporter permease n=1 Tax=Gordonia sp. (in: high G+C Gram-positive bacteria) TaxID=84139 RepID=UPI003BB4B4A6
MVGLVGLLILSLAIGVVIGSVGLSLGEVFAAVGARLHLVDGVDPATRHIVVNLRMPRVVTASAVGAGLAVAGAVLQSLTGNVLADPYLLGMSSGASVGAVVVLTTSLGSAATVGMGAVSTAAFIGALGALALVFAIATTRSGALLPNRLILAGVAVAQGGAAITSAIVYFGDRDAAATVLRWTLGSVAGARWPSTILVAVTVTAVLAVVWLYARTLDAFAFGDRAASSLGVPVVATRWVLYLVVSLCTAVLVAQTGIIGFVGLVIPHIARAIVGPLHRRLLPATALIGAVLLVWTDILARTVLPGRELPLGLVTAIVGVPVFVWILRSHGAAA